MKESCPGSKEIRNPYPDELVCSFCCHKNEIWSDEPDMICKGCGKTITRDIMPSCVLWCQAAKECVGTEKYETIVKKLTAQADEKK
jgi:predicted amidophosphoribosyltransferase